MLNISLTNRSSMAPLLLNAAFCAILLLAGVRIGTARAQNPPPGHKLLTDADRFADGHVAALDRQLHLTPDQKSKLRPIFKDEAQQLFAIMNNTAMPVEQKQAAIEKLHLETAAKVDSILTPEQRKQVPTPNPQAIRPTASHT